MGTLQTTKGGCWFHTGPYSRSSNGLSVAAESPHFYRGFRVVAGPLPGRVLRGGGWHCSPWWLRSVARFNSRWPPSWNGGIGFRVVAPLPTYVLRGGSWDIYPRWLQSAARNAWAPGKKFGGMGFRIVKEDS